MDKGHPVVMGTATSIAKHRTMIPQITRPGCALSKGNRNNDVTGFVVTHYAPEKTGLSQPDHGDVFHPV